MGVRREFKDKVVLITGAAGGLGSAFARRFSREGARLGLLDLDASRLEGLAAELVGQGGSALPLICDITQEAQCRNSVRALTREWGGVDLLINNAGITQRSAFAQTQARVFRQVMEVNFFGSLNCTQAALPSLLARRGAIVVISSVAGFAPLLGRSGYAASKHALHGLFASLRSELKGRGVDVCLVCPGFTNTGIAGAALDGDGSLTSHPQSTVGRIATPGEVAAAVHEAARRARPITILSTAGKLTWLLNRISPRLYERIMTHSLERELKR